MPFNENKLLEKITLLDIQRLTEQRRMSSYLTTSGLPFQILGQTHY